MLVLRPRPVIDIPATLPAKTKNHHNRLHHVGLVGSMETAIRNFRLFQQFFEKCFEHSSARQCFYTSAGFYQHFITEIHHI